MGNITRTDYYTAPPGTTDTLGTSAPMVTGYVRIYRSWYPETVERSGEVIEADLQEHLTAAYERLPLWRRLWLWLRWRLTESWPR